MKKLFERVDCSEEHPKDSNFYETNLGVIFYDEIQRRWTDHEDRTVFPSRWYKEVTELMYIEKEGAIKSVLENYIPVSKTGRKPNDIVELSEINFLKEHDLFQINDMFRQRTDTLKAIIHKEQSKH